jgi:hypothetical protein
MAKITAVTTFKHDVEEYKEGKTYDVDDRLAGYFVGVGWANAEGYEDVFGVNTPPDVVDIQPDNVTVRTSAKEKK